MSNKSNFTVAAFQGSIQPGNIHKNLDKTLSQLSIADESGVDILCMPESFLHGYFEDKEQACKYSIDLQSTDYAKLLEHFSGYKNTTLLLGINERKSNSIYNTVVVIEGGKHIGQYRKAYTYPPYDYFALGKDFPVFEKRGVKYSIIICLDSVYREPAQIGALKGAQIIFCPMFNRVPQSDRMLNFVNKNSHLISRAYDNQCWFVTSDIIWNQGDGRVCPGRTLILNDDGEIVANSKPFQEMQLSVDIPMTALSGPTAYKWRRRLGNSELFDIVKDAYNEASFTD